MMTRPYARNALLQRRIRNLFGGVVDNIRRMVFVTKINDLTHFQGFARGQVYECRALPDTTLLTLGQGVVCHAVRGSTELLYIQANLAELPYQELWFSPGADSDVTGRGQLWVLSSDPATPLPVWVWTAETDFEYITHICWSKAGPGLYVFTFLDDWELPPTVRVYKVNQITRAVALVVEFVGIDSEPGDPPVYATADAVVDSAQFLNQIWVVMGGRRNPSGIFGVFDPLGGTFAHAWTMPHAYPIEGWGGGMATNSGNDRLFGSDGHSVYEYAGGGAWGLDINLKTAFGSIDSVAMITDWEDDLIHHGQLIVADMGAALTVVRNGGWSAGCPNPGDIDFGITSMCNLYSELTGALIATYAISWGAIADPGGRLFRKDAGQPWVLDGTVGTNTILPATQGLAQLAGKLYILTNDSDWGGVTKLYRRDGLGSYIELWDSTTEFFMLYAANGHLTGMALAPSPTALAPELALMRRCHEAN